MTGRKITDYRDLRRALQARGFTVSQVQNGNGHLAVWLGEKKLPISIPSGHGTRDPRAVRNWISLFRRLTGVDLRA